MYEYAARCLRVVDGDTAVFDIDVGLSVHVHESCRLYGINAPEMRGATREDGVAAMSYLQGLLGAGPLVVRTIKDRKCKYGRYLVVIERDGVDVNRAMVDAGMAVEYEC